MYTHMHTQTPLPLTAFQQQSRTALLGHLLPSLHEHQVVLQGMELTGTGGEPTTRAGTCRHFLLMYACDCVCMRACVCVYVYVYVWVHVCMRVNFSVCMFRCVCL